MPKSKSKRHAKIRSNKRRLPQKPNKAKIEKLVYTHKPTTTSEIDEAKKKLGSSSSKSNNTCTKNACNEVASSTCNYCKKQYCNVHSEPTLAMGLKTKTSLTDRDRRNDPELYDKIMTDWNRTDGHACSSYTERWYKDHEQKLYKKYNEFGYKYDYLYASSKKSTGFANHIKRIKDALGIRK